MRTADICLEEIFNGIPPEKREETGHLQKPVF